MNKQKEWKCPVTKWTQNSQKTKCIQNINKKKERIKIDIIICRSDFALQIYPQLQVSECSESVLDRAVKPPVNMSGLMRF